MTNLVHNSYSFINEYLSSSLRYGSFAASASGFQ